MMLYCRDGAQAAVTAALEARGLRRLDFRFEEGGARVLLNAGLRLPETAPRAAPAADAPEARRVSRRGRLMLLASLLASDALGVVVAAAAAYLLVFGGRPAGRTTTPWPWRWACCRG